MITANERRLANYFADEILRTVKTAKSLLIDKKVILLTGKYKDRVGKVTAVIPSVSHGLVWLVMVYAKEGETYLNSDAESRQYRPISHFDVCDT